MVKKILYVPEQMELDLGPKEPPCPGCRIGAKQESQCDGCVRKTFAQVRPIVELEECRMGSN